MNSMLTFLFLKYIAAGLTASLVILIVIALRLILKRIPKRAITVLWTAVWIRLLVPVPIRSSLSLIPQEAVQTFNALPRFDMPAENVCTNPAGDQNSVFAILAVIWLVVLIAIVLYALISLMLLRRRFQPCPDIGSVPVDLARRAISTYVCPGIVSAFVFGIFRPVIVLPENLSKDDRRCILLHEATHIRRFDPQQKLIAYIACAVHWANPLVWIAFRLFDNDTEMACDEAVLRFAEISPIAYSQALLNAVSKRNGSSFVSFGAGNVCARISRILCGRTVSPRMLLSFTVICTVIACVLLFDPLEAANVLPIDNVPVISQIQDIEPEPVISEYKTELPKDVSSDIPKNQEQASPVKKQPVSPKPASEAVPEPKDIPGEEMYTVVTIDLRSLRSQNE